MALLLMHASATLHQIVGEYDFEVHGSLSSRYCVGQVKRGTSFPFDKDDVVVTVPCETILAE